MVSLITFTYGVFFSLHIHGDCASATSIAKINGFCFSDFADLKSSTNRFVEVLQPAFGFYHHRIQYSNVVTSSFQIGSDFVASSFDCDDIVVSVRGLVCIPVHI